MGTPVLELDNVNTYYGKIHALKGVSLTVERGEVVTLIGSNGAGKTTTLRTISGLLRPKQGDIKLNGSSIITVSPHKVVEMGIGQVPEGRGVFPALTVLENLEMGAFLLRNNAEFERRIDLVFSLFPRLQERMTQRGGTLSGGEQQMLTLGRALMTNPELLILADATEGVEPLIAREIWRIVR
ncbi:MAG: ABC transporter ATP-binding protein, partial [Caldilineaceae bacterium]|nr:ABC transporter ATP-binding protein [Caldilineaceae bacterium]